MSLKKIVDKEGDRKQYPQAKSRVTISYNSWFHDPTKTETKFRGRQIGRTMSDVTVELGTGLLLAACEAEIVKMSVGERAFLIVPGSLAYGKQGIPNLVPPDTDIVILVELLNVKDC